MFRTCYTIDKCVDPKVPVLRILNVYLGSQIMIFFHPGRIQQQQKRGADKINYLWHFFLFIVYRYLTKLTIINIFELEKDLIQLRQNLSIFNPKFLLSSQNTMHQIQDPDTQRWKTVPYDTYGNK